MNSTSINTKLFIIFLFLSFLLSFQTIFSQEFDTLWTRRYDRTFEDIKKILTVENNSFLVIYNTYGANGPIVAKFNVNGDTLWSTEISHERFSRFETHIHDIAMGKDGNYMALSTVGHNSAWYEYHDSTLVTNISPKGEILSQYIYGGGHHYRNYCITSSKTGGYYIAGGYVYYKTVPVTLPIMKIADNGSEFFRREFDIVSFDWGENFDILETSDTNIVVCGYKYVMKLDRYLEKIIWTNKDDSLSKYKFMWIRETPDGGFIAGVNTSDWIEKLIKFDSDGNILWVTKPTIPKSPGLHLSDAVVNHDGTIVLSGLARFNYGAFEHIILKISDKGEILTYYLNTLLRTSTDPHITKFSDGSYITTPYSQFHYMLLVKYKLHNGTDVEYQNDVPKNFDMLQNYPNPFNPSTTIKYKIGEAGFVTLKIYNLLGQEVTTLVNKEQTSGNYSINFNASKLNSGVYFYKISIGNFTDSKKMILMK